MELKIREKVGYALGDAGANFFWKSGEFFLLVFYTDAFGLSPAQAGTMFLVARVIDALIDPFVGALADRTRTKMGSFRPYLLFGAVPLSILGVLTWTVPELGSTGRLVYAYVTYILFMISYTIVNIPYSALMGVMTTDPVERTALSSARFIGAFGVGLVVQFMTMRLVQSFGGGSTAQGFSRTIALYSLLSLLLTWACYWSTVERVAPQAEGGPKLSRELKELFENESWRALSGLCVLVIANFAIRGSSFVYFFKYNLAGASLFGVASSHELLGYFLTVGGIMGLLGVVVTKPLVRRVGKKNGYILAMAIGSVLSLPLFFLGRDEIGWIFGLNLLINFALGPTAPLLFAMFGDAADYAEWKTGRRSTGLVFAGAMFALKMGGAVGGFLSGVGLSYVGYVADQVQTSSTLTGIASLVSWVPALLGFASLAWFAKYPLTEVRLAELQRELERRRGTTPKVPQKEESAQALLDDGTSSVAVG